MTGRLVAIGLVSMLGQVVLLRELDVAFYGSELVYVLALGAWMFGTAAGAVAGRRVSPPNAAIVRGLLVAVAWALPLAIVFTREMRRWLGGVPGAYLPFPTQMLGLALAVIPVSLLLGLLFARAARGFVASGRTLAGAYAVESAGGIAGGLLATVGIAGGMQNLTLGFACAMVAALAAARRGRARGSPMPGRLVAATVPVLAVGLLWNGAFDRALTARNHPSLVATRDSPYGRITVTRAGDQLVVYENDALAFESEGTEAEEFVHLAAIQRAAPRRVLVLGGGIEGVVREVLRHHPASVDWVELDPVPIGLVRPRLSADARHALDDPAVRAIIADPRSFLDRAGRYDLILVGMPEPASGGTNRFYTREFFRACARRLDPGGVLAFRLRGAENLWTPIQTGRAASIHRALTSVFADSVVLPGATNTFLASDRPLERDPEVLAGRLARRAVGARLVIPPYVEYLYSNDRFREIGELLEQTEAPPNTDARPACYLATLLLWLSRFFPSVALVDLPEMHVIDGARSLPAWLAVAAVAVLLLAARRHPRSRRVLLALLAGAAGMVIETVLILDYQVHRGVLFRDLGLLVTLFMTGLALGAGWIDHRHRAGLRSGTRPRWEGPALILALAALCAGTGTLVAAGATGTLAIDGALLLVAGVFVAALFGHASLIGSPEPASTVGPLYAADLLGGCAGSLAASLALIPLLGLSGAAIAATVAVLLGWALA